MFHVPNIVPATTLVGTHKGVLESKWGWVGLLPAELPTSHRRSDCLSHSYHHNVCFIPSHSLFQVYFKLLLLFHYAEDCVWFCLCISIMELCPLACVRIQKVSISLKRMRTPDVEPFISNSSFKTQNKANH